MLANDSDAEDDALTITAVGSAVNGTATLSEDKATVTYAHDGSEITSGSFTYTVSDGSASDTATVEVTVTPVNDAPVTVDDTATVDEGGTVDITASTLLANDSDPEDDTISITAVGSAVNGAITLSEDKATVTYTHDGSETTAGSFTYTVSDGSAADTATVGVTVTPVNDAPGAPTLADQTAIAGQPFTYTVPEVIRPGRRHPHLQRGLGAGLEPSAGLAQLRRGHPHLHWRSAQGTRCRPSSGRGRGVRRVVQVVQGLLHADRCAAAKPGVGSLNNRRPDCNRRPDFHLRRAGVH